MLWPIYVPSKGRAGNSKTIEKLRAEGIPHNIFVEPQDYEAYVAAYPGSGIQQLQQNNHGIAFVRNAILNFARETGEPWFWMFDDDIKDFYRTENKKTIKITMQECLTAAQKLIEPLENTVGQAALEYQQFAWSQTKPLKFTGYCDVAVAINVGRLPSFIRYRGHLNLKEDRDFTLQVLSMGLETARCSMLSFAAPKNGSNKGGLYDAYKEAGREARASLAMAEQWPGVCVPFTKPDGRQDVKINWSALRAKV